MEWSMTISSFAAGPAPAPDMSGTYQPGVCNIGPREIARRRMAGHVGLLLTLGVLAALLIFDAPAWLRLILLVPAAGSASGYLQAYLKFCAGYGQLGVFNFGEVGDTHEVASDEARRADRRRARQIGLASFAIGVLVAGVAILIPA
jgi:ferric-dicitrate binding protein FerR (iron transport regulator)